MTKTTRILYFMLKCLLVLAVGSASAMAEAPGDIRYERRTGDAAEAASELSSFPPAVFPHWIHRINYRCDACHDSLFEMKRGGTLVTMELISRGKVCGACHNGQTAFESEFQTCNKCHVDVEE